MFQNILKTNDICNNVPNFINVYNKYLPVPFFNSEKKMYATKVHGLALISFFQSLFNNYIQHFNRHEPKVIKNVDFLWRGASIPIQG